MDLAKNAVDVGLYTDDLETSRAFWGDVVGLPYQELLKAGAGVHQHRYGLHGAVLKLNASREPLEQATSGLRGLRIASGAITEPTSFSSPEGVAVELVPPGHDGVDATEIQTVVSDGASARRWWVEGIGATEDGARFRVGETLIAVRTSERLPAGSMRRRGLTYLTVQVRDLDTEHARMLDLGFEEGTAPVRLGDVAYISFVRTADGDWLELSQRASLTGPLPDDVRRVG